VDDTVNIVQALKDDVERLRRVMALNIKVGDTYPGESQIERIKSIIQELERVIKST
jgi:hypothetical protein